MNGFYLTFKKFYKEDAVQAGMFLALILCLCFFSVIFLNKTLTSLQVPGVQGHGPYGYSSDFTHRALVDPGGSTWSPRPQTALISQQLKEGISPLWNPYMGIGMPLAGNMDSNAFNPLRSLLHLDPSPYMWDIFLLTRLLLAGIFAYLFLRAINLSHLSSLFSSLLFMLSGYFIISIDMHHLDVEIFLPFIFLCYEKIIRKANVLKWGLLLSLGIIFLLTGGQPQSVFLILVFGSVYYFFRLFSFPENRKWKVVKKYIFIYIIFHLLGFALSAILLFPFFEFYTLSFNNHDVTSGRILGLSYNPYFSDFISFITPYFLGPIHGSWLDNYSWHILTRGYFGVTAALFAIAVVLTTLRKKSTGNSLIYFFALALFLMMGKFYGLPLVNWVGELPIANMVNFGKYMGPLMAFCVAVLAGIGLERFARPESESAELKKAAMVLFFVIAGTLLYYLAYINDLPGNKVLHTVLIQLAATSSIIVFIIWGAKFIQRKKLLVGRKFQISIIVIALIELFIYIPNPGLFKDRNDRADIFEKAPYIDYLQSNLEEYRVIGVDGILYPDFGSAFGIGDLRVLDALLPKRYMEYIGDNFKLPAPPDRFTGDQGIDFRNQGTRRALNLLGVKYFISHTELEDNHNMIADILKDGKIVYTPGEPASKWVNSSSVDINGINKRVLFSHAPSSIDYPLQIPEKASLDFSIGMVPGSWGPDKGDGVLFEITVRDGREEEKIFSQYIDPKNNIQDRKWFDYSLDMSGYAGREIVLVLTTYAGLNNGKDNAYDWSVWGRIFLNSPDLNSSDHPSLGAKLVYERGGKIYENKEVFPRAFVANDYELLTKKEDILKRLKDSNFPLRDKIILEEDLPEMLRSTITKHQVRSDVNIKRYSSQQVEILADMKSPGFLVLSDLYYPGWNAYVDEKKVKIYQTNYILRSIFLGAGVHTVKFVYEPTSFRIGSWISGTAVLFFVILVGVWLRRARRPLRTEDLTTPSTRIL